MYRVIYYIDEQSVDDDSWEAIEDLTHDEAAVLEGLINKGRLPMLGVQAMADCFE